MPPSQHNPVKLGLSVKCEILEINNVSHLFKVDLWVEVGYQILDERGKNVFKREGARDQFVLLKDEEISKMGGVQPPLVLYTADTLDVQSQGTEVNYATGEFKHYTNWIATIREILHLKKFPMDRQVLRIPFESTGQEEWEFAKTWYNTEPPWAKTISTAYGACSLSTPEWELRGYRINVHHNVAVITFWVERKSMFYLLNYSFTAFVLVLLNLCTIGFSPADLDKRMSVTLTLLLTLVAFKFVMMSNIPKIPYLTLLDWNMMFAFFIMAFGAGWNVFVSLGVSNWGNFGLGVDEPLFVAPSLGDLAYWKRVDTIILLTINATWIAAHAVVVVLSCTGRLRSAWDVVERDNAKTTSKWDKVEIEEEVVIPEGAGELQLSTDVTRPF